MGRTYRLNKRAETQAQTRQRIVEATIDLHSTLGPSRTTISAIAERAGVQRHTVYRHFPQERDLQMACSGLHMERSPFPDPEALLELGDPGERLRRGVEAVYAYYADNEGLLANLARDSELHELTREVFGLRVGPIVGRYVEILSAGRRGRRRERLAAAVGVALDFRTWQTLVRRHGLAQAAAVDTAVAMVRCQ